MLLIEGWAIWVFEKVYSTKILTNSGIQHGNTHKKDEAQHFISDNCIYKGV